MGKHLVTCRSHQQVPSVIHSHHQHTPESSGVSTRLLGREPNAFEQLGRGMPHACHSKIRNQSNIIRSHTRNHKMGSHQPGRVPSSRIWGPAADLCRFCLTMQENYHSDHTMWMPRSAASTFMRRVTQLNGGHQAFYILGFFLTKLQHLPTAGYTVATRINPSIVADTGQQQPRATAF